jgi:outer membrane protein OmpA-like peptidoglycan-associated protein
MPKQQLVLVVAAIMSPMVARAQPAPAATHEMKIDCEHAPTCIATEFADALSSQPVGPAALRLDSLIMFEPGSARVYSRSREKLMALAASWRDHARWMVITVEGHADASHNVALAQQRADKIRGYLIRYGVAAEYVVAIGHDPVPGDTPVKHATGGRVDLTIAFCDPTSEACRGNGLQSTPAAVSKKQ